MVLPMQEVPLISYSDFIAILLTAIAVLLAVLGVIFALVSIVLGMLAFYGYRDILQMAQKRIEEIIARYPSAEVFEARTEAILKELQPKKAEEAKSPAAASDAVVQSTTEGAVSPPYPGKEV